MKYALPLIACIGAFFYFFSHPTGVQPIQKSESADQAPLGKPAPAFSLPMSSGGIFTQKDLQGSLLVFTASWCPSCQSSLPALENLSLPINVVLYRDASEHYGLENLKKFNKIGEDIDTRVSHDTWGVFNIPQFFLIDKNGIIVWHHMGGIESSTLQEAIKKYISHD